MVSDNVISFAQGANSPRRRSADPRMQQLVAACRAEIAETLPRLTQELFEHIDDELYQLADKSSSDVLQTRYFDAMRELRKLRTTIEQNFLRAHLSSFENFWTQPGSVEEPRTLDDAGDELTLVDEEELEENLAVSGMVSKAENRYHRELFALNMRFAQIAGIPDLTTKLNPVGPSALAEGFRTALRLWEGDLSVRLVVFKLFDRYVMGYVGGLYDDLNDKLMEAGILPKIVQRARRNPIAPSVQRARENAPVEHGGDEGQADYHGGADTTQEQQILNMLGQLLSMRRGHGANNLSSVRLPGGGDAAHHQHLPPVESNDLVDALSHLQHEVSVEAPVSLAEIQQLQAEMLVSLGRELEMGSREVPVKRLNSVDQDVIDVIGMLFDFILDDSNVPDTMKALLGRLQIPMLKVAVMDRSFFANKQHPARRLLNTLARAAMGWVDDGDRSAKSLFGRIEAAVNRILSDFSDDVNLFVQVYDEFSNFIEREARGAEVAEERINQVTRGQEQLLIARRRVAEVLNEFRTEQPDLPMAVVNILREGWHDVMLLAYLREGEDSAAWKHAYDAVNELIWSVQPKAEPTERQRLLKAIPELLKKLRDGLNNISFDQHRAGQLFKELQACHIAALRGENNEPAAEDADEVVPEGVVLASEPEPEMVEDEFLDKAKNLAVGQWLEWESDGNWVRGKLSWRSEVSSNCIFVNRKGMKSAEMTINDIAVLFRNEQARLLEDINTPLMDRALNAMLNALGDDDKPAEPA